MTGRSEMKGKFIILLILAFFLSNVRNIQADPSVTSLSDIEQNPVSGGQVGNIIFVKGEGVSSGSEIQLYWDIIKEWDGKEGLINSSIGLPNGDFEVSFSIPETVYGYHYLWFKEVGTTVKIFGPIQFDVNASMTLNPKRGLKNDIVTINGFGFHATTSINSIEFDGTPIDTNPSVPTTNGVGSWTATFEVPDVGKGEYDIIVADTFGSSTSTLFNVSPVITLNQLNGSVGNVVQVSGRGFTPSGTVISVTLDGIDCGVLDVGDLSINTNGALTFDLVVPSVSKGGKAYSLFVLDNGGQSSNIGFYVIDIPAIQLEPRFGSPGEIIGIYGSHFTAFGEDVVIKFNGNQVLTLEPNSNGEITGVFWVPALPSGVFLVEAEQSNYNIQATESFRVGTISVLLAPINGSTGTLVSLTGIGFTAQGKWDAFFDDIQLFSNMDVSGDTTFSGSFYVPIVDTGAHSITVIDVSENIEVVIPFYVDGNTSLEISPQSAPIGFNISIEGEYFSESGGTIGVNFVIYNSTDSFTMNVYENTGSVTTGSNGEFSAWWIIPENLELGQYWINATDEKGMNYQGTFKVTAKFLEISTRESVYYRGNIESKRIVRFNIESSFEEVGSYIVISDSNDFNQWRTDDFDFWLEKEVTYIVPIFSQTSLGVPMTLDEYAPIGNWTWTWYNSDDEILALGAFLVEEDPVIDDEENGDNVTDEVITNLQQEIQQLKEIIEELTMDLQDAMIVINDISNAANESLYEFESSLEEAHNEATESRSMSGEAIVEAETAKIIAGNANSLAENTQTIANQINETLSELKIEMEETKKNTEQALNSDNILKIIAFISLLLSIAAAGQSYFGFFKFSK